VGEPFRRVSWFSASGKTMIGIQGSGGQKPRGFSTSPASRSCRRPRSRASQFPMGFQFAVKPTGRITESFDTAVTLCPF
jgi:hypothetical protein